MTVFVITDANDIAIGAVLLQDFGDGLQPVAYELWKLQDAEKNFMVHDKEMLAIVHAFKTWRCYLTGADVTVRTDHKSLHIPPPPDIILISGYDFLRTLLIQESHDNPTSRHFGVDKTMKTLQRNYYWPNMADDVRKYVSSCTAYQIMKSSHQRAAGLLQPLDPPERPWQHVTMDCVTGPSGNDAILVVVDRLTKMVHFIACQQKITAEQTAQLFIANVIRLHGLPSAIISDRDPKFTSNFWRHLWDQFGTKQQFSSAYHPQTDGQTERVNQTMEQLIRTTCTDPQTWERSLPLLEFAYNNAPSATTHQSTFFLNYGQDPVVPTTPNIETPVPRSQRFAEDILAAREKAAEAIRKANLVASRQADRHRRDVTDNVGDIVLLDTRNLRLPIPSKLRPRFCGPFQVTKMVTPVTAHLRLPTDWRHHPAFHVSLLRPYIPSSSDLARQRIMARSDI
ncbi:hypothetical protein CLOM_g10820 [Closterium sp. NIES-68]|nr:hypothetical protein CLOM_g10820 [Closterium sp. NIES-68]